MLTILQRLIINFLFVVTIEIDYHRVTDYHEFDLSYYCTFYLTIPPCQSLQYTQQIKTGFNEYFLLVQFIIGF